ncbi:hypothetical protein J6590_015051 [Homalodisca vitripennis]|nr:hypothetical protein J6590_015051 [Homalodisca vitripennis]
MLGSRLESLEPSHVPGPIVSVPCSACPRAYSALLSMPQSLLCLCLFHHAPEPIVPCSACPQNLLYLCLFQHAPKTIVPVPCSACPRAYSALLSMPQSLLCLCLFQHALEPIVHVPCSACSRAYSV